MIMRTAVIISLRKELMLDLMRMALRDIEESYETFIDNQRKGYQRGLENICLLCLLLLLLLFFVYM